MSLNASEQVGRKSMSQMGKWCVIRLGWAVATAQSPETDMAETARAIY